MKKLDSHAAGLKLAAMAAKSLALLPAACMICSIYSQTNSLSMLVSYLIAAARYGAGIFHLLL